MKECGEVLETVRVGGKSFIIAGVVLLLLYPLMAFSQGVVYNPETISSLSVLVVVLFSFVVTYKTSALYITQYGLITKGVFFEYHRIKKYDIVDNGKKTAISFTVKNHKDKEVNYYYRLSKIEKINIEKIMDSYFHKNKKNKKKNK
jgi:uncharacterized membrane protein YobD (UPF0266 family)